MKVKLKRCPFCGGHAKLMRYKYMYAVWCTKCDIGTLWRCREKRPDENREWAINNWNNRVEEGGDK